jgi:hypothetical protein
MKHVSKLLFLSSLLIIAVVSCKKDEKKVFFNGGTSPVITGSLTGSIPLAFANQDNVAIKFSWTNPAYQFNTGVSSQNVNYIVEIDKVGFNFNSAAKKSIAISSDLDKTFTQSELNDILLNQLQFNPGAVANIDVRVIATLGASGAGKLISNTLKYSVVPYAIPPKVDPPSTGKLFITGSATPASWQCGCGEAELLTQKFNQISTTLYELPSINLTGGGSYLFLPKYGDWGAKYGGTGANNANNVNGDDFKPNGGDILAPPVSGAYKITVDFQRGKFTVTKL